MEDTIMSNQLQTKPKFSLAIQSDAYKKLINNTLGDPKRASKFIASISSAVATNPTLQECDAGSILSGALVGEALNLSPSPQLGQYYLVPFNTKNPDGTYSKKAQFQLGYKGYIQLAIRSGQYKKLNVIAIKEGELIKYDPLNEEIEVKLIEDEEERENAKTIGYYATFELLNGYKKTMYWTKKKMEAHAIKYSKGYAAKKGYTFWEKDFDGMAYKTMYRQLISKGGAPMSIEMQDAYIKDMSVVKEDGTYDYVDTQEINLEPVADISVNEVEEINVEPEIKEPKKVSLDEI
jgi:recombination protein RecT